MDARAAFDAPHGGQGHVEHPVGRKDDGSVRQRLGSDRDKHHRVELGMHDGAGGRKGVSGRPGWRGDDQAIGAQGIHVGFADFDAHLDHASATRAVEYDIVQRRGREHLGIAAPDAAGKQHAGFGFVAPLQQGTERGRRIFDGDVGDEAKPPMVDPDHRHIERGQLARRAQHGAVAARHDREVCPLPDLCVGGAGVLAHARVVGCFGFDQHGAPGCDEQHGQVPQMGLQAGVLITANQRDGGEGHRGARPEKN